MIDYSLLPSTETQLILAIRLVLACICGAAVGFERSRRQKEAGLRTHIIVALGSALVMLVSKYAFFDVVINESMQVDVSRLASNIITGISFLGAGIIFTRGINIKGLTTAAGIWATAGVGLAMGSGLYVIAFSATFIIILVHLLLHGVYDDSSYLATVKLSFSPDENPTEYIAAHIEAPFHCSVKSMKVRHTENEHVDVQIELQSHRGHDWKDNADAIMADSHVYYIEL